MEITIPKRNIKKEAYELMFAVLNKSNSPRKVVESYHYQL